MICPVAAAESFDGIEAGRKEVNPAAVLAKYCKIFSVIIVFPDKSSFQVKIINQVSIASPPLREAIFSLARCWIPFIDHS